MFSGKERTFRDNSGGIVTCTRLKSATCRIGFEKKYFPGMQVGMYGWERAHETGDIPVTAGPEGIVNAPYEVTVYYQRLRLDHYVMLLFSRKAQQVEIWLTTTLYTYPCTHKVRKIMYHVDAVKQRTAYGLFDAVVSIEDKRISPRITVDTRELIAQREWSRVLH